MENKYNYEIGIHFKENTTLKQKQSIYKYIEEYITDFEEKDIKNKELALFLINTKNILMIKSILNKNSNLIRYFYIEDIKNKKFV